MKLQTDQSAIIIEMIKSKKYKVIGVADNRGKTVDFMDKRTRVRRTFAKQDYNRARAQMAGW